MKTKILRITAAILFTLLMTIYPTFIVLSIWMLYVISFPFHAEDETAMDRQIGYGMFSAILIVSLICTISGLLYLYKKNINLIFTLPVYLLLPISIPYLLLQVKIKNNREVYEIDDSLFSTFLLTVTSIINYLLAFLELFFGVLILPAAKAEPFVLFFGIPLAIIGLFMFVGTTANIINYQRENLIASRISYIGFTFVWVYKAYKASLIRNNLYPIKTIKREEKIKAA